MQPFTIAERLRQLQLDEEKGNKNEQEKEVFEQLLNGT
jgi:hypothetical protein